MFSYHYRLTQLQHEDLLEEARGRRLARKARSRGMESQVWRRVSARAGIALIRMGRMLGASETEALDCGGSC